MLESLFNIAAGFRASKLCLKETPAQIFFCENFKTPPVAASEVFCEDFVDSSGENAFFRVLEDSI